MDDGKKEIVSSKLFKKLYIFIIGSLLVNLIFLTVYITSGLKNLLEQQLSTVLIGYYNELRVITDYNEDNLESISNRARLDGISIYIYDLNKNESIYKQEDGLIKVPLDFELKPIINKLLNKNEGTCLNPSEIEKTKINDIIDSSNSFTLIGKTYNQSLIILHTPYQQIVNTQTVATRAVLYASILSSFLIGLPSYLFAYSYILPIKKLSNMANSINQKDYSHRVNIYTNDEVQVLAETMNEMSSSIESHISEMEDQLKEKEMLLRNQKMLTSDLSHELKTPITLISGFSNLLMDDMKNPMLEQNDKIEYQNMVIEECLRMEEIINRMTKITQLESGSFKLDKQIFPIKSLYNSLYRKYKDLASEKGHTLFLDIREDLFVNADYLEIESVFVNYLVNAIKYATERATIVLRARSDNENIIMSVENDGVQIPEDEIPKLWDKLYRSDKARSRDMKSTGIGLSLVKATMELHGGEYGMKNTHRGVEFYIVLPKATDPEKLHEIPE